MKIIRYQDSHGQVGFGAEQQDGTVLKIRGEIYPHPEVSEDKAHVQSILAPIIPSMIWGIGLNYRRHAEEAALKIPEYPMVFAKSPSAIQNPGDPIQIPTHLKSSEVDYEGELAVVIGKACKNVDYKHALDFVLGYTCANDISARDWQLKRGGGQWCRGKTFDTFLPIGPRLVTRDEIPNPNSVRIQTILNGETVQDSNSNDLIFDIPNLIEFLSGSTTLLPGTMILTGTPQGVGITRKPPLWLKAGDQISIVIENVGMLTNPVEDEPA